jgi:hypothetical protein
MRFLKRSFDHSFVFYSKYRTCVTEVAPYGITKVYKQQEQAKDFESMKIRVKRKELNKCR